MTHPDLSERLENIIGWLFVLTLVVLVSGCHTEPDLASLYNREARYHDTKRNPVIVIPGILGSKMVQQDTGRVVWGAFSGDYANPSKPDGARLFALPMKQGESLAHLRDDVIPNGALDRIKVDFFGLPVELNAYVNILGTLGVGGYRDQTLGSLGQIDYGTDHYTCFQFDYDWRRDIVESAKQLDQFIKEKRKFVQKKLTEQYGEGDYPVKFDLVAHSMGGLVARYYLRYGGADLSDDGSVPEVTWAGAQNIERVIIVGTPNAGSPVVLEQLVWGTKFAFFLPRYPAAVLGTMPALYELLPRPRHRRVVDADHPQGTPLDVYDPNLWIKLRWGLADPRQDSVLAQLLPEVDVAHVRREIAVDHLEKCLKRAKQFHQAIDQPAKPPKGVRLYLMAGDAVDTLSRLSVKMTKGTMKPSAYEAGDGTVGRSEALQDERMGVDEKHWTPRVITPIAWSQVFFLFTDHLGLTSDPAFTDNVLYILLEEPTDEPAVQENNLSMTNQNYE